MARLLLQVLSTEHIMFSFFYLKNWKFFRLTLVLMIIEINPIEDCRNAENSILFLCSIIMWLDLATICCTAVTFYDNTMQ